MKNIKYTTYRKYKIYKMCKIYKIYKDIEYTKYIKIYKIYNKVKNIFYNNVPPKWSYNGSPLPFRKKKMPSGNTSKNICYNIFILLYKNGPNN